MKRNGATTFWENWPDDAHSKLHSSYLHIGYLFIEATVPANTTARLEFPTGDPSTVPRATGWRIAWRPGA